jgi:GrpB-like predicted nucleotidyltransferase (UPF0157 family)
MKNSMEERKPEKIINNLDTETVTFKPVELFKELAYKVFEQESKKILAELPFAEVHHIGSTAIPGSITKGDLDVSVRVKKEDFERAIEALKRMYEINQPENWTEGFASFKTDPDTLEIDFGAQLTVIDSEEDVFLRNKAVLQSHPLLVEKLNQIKLKYEGKLMTEYRKEKYEFFKQAEFQKQGN